MKQVPISMRQHMPWLVVLAGMAVAVGAYLQALNYPFVSDDDFYITSNLKLAGLRFAEIWRLMVEPYNPYEFLPLRDFSYWLDLTLFGTNPAAFRLHNIFLYLLCCLPVYGATAGLWRYFKPAGAASAPWVAAIVTALFAIHPAHVEAVVWASGRKDVLAGLFAMLALWLAVRAKRETGLSPPLAFAALAALAAAMLAKATAAVMAAIIALLWLLFWRDIPAGLRRRPALLWPLAAVLIVAVMAPLFMSYSTVSLPSYWGGEAITRALAVTGWLARLVVTPGSRHYMYPVFEDAGLWWTVVLGGVVLLAAAAGAVMLLRKKSLEGFTLLAFGMLCLPYMQLSPYITHSLVTDRFLFIAAWPALLLLAATVWRLKPALRWAVFLLVALPWFFQTVERPRDWRSYDALIEVESSSYRGYYLPIFQNIEKSLSRGQYGEAREMAGTITDTEIRNLIIRLVEGAHAVAVEAVQTGDPRDALVRLQELGPLLRQPLPQARWNTPLFSFWLSSRNLLMVEWDTLGRNFPADSSVQREVRLRQEAGL